MRHESQISFFCVWISSWPSTACWEDRSSPSRPSGRPAAQAAAPRAPPAARWPRACSQPAPRRLHRCRFAVSLKPGRVSFRFRIVWAVLCPLRFQMNFRISVSICTKKSAGILTRGRLCAYWGLLAFFHDVSWFPDCKFCAAFVPCVLTNFTLIATVVRGVVF